MQHSRSMFDLSSWSAESTSASGGGFEAPSKMGSADKLRTQCEHERVRPTPLDPEPGLAGYSFPFPEGCNAQACNDNAIPQSCGITDLHVVDIASPWSTADGSEKWFAEEDSEEDPDEETCGILAGPSEVTGCDIPKSRSIPHPAAMHPIAPIPAARNPIPQSLLQPSIASHTPSYSHASDPTPHLTAQSPFTHPLVKHRTPSHTPCTAQHPVRYLLPQYPSPSYAGSPESQPQVGTDLASSPAGRMPRQWFAESIGL